MVFNGFKALNPLNKRLYRILKLLFWSGNLIVVPQFSTV
jgi:hypothetical protein